MSSGPSVPTPQNPTVTAQTQQDFNTKAGEASQQGSMVNQVNPFGSFTYNQTGVSANGTPIYTLKSDLSPANQQLLDLLNASKTTAGTQAGQLISNANYGAASPSDVIGNATKGLTQQALNQQIDYLKPYQDYQRQQMDTQLRNQGFAPGQPAYDMQMKKLQNDQDSSVQNYLSNIQGQMMQQATQQYLLPLTMGQQLQAWGAPISSTMQQTPALSIQPANYTGAVANYDQAAMQAYNAQKQQQNAMLSGLFGIGTGVLGAMATGGASIPGSLLGMSSLFSGGSGSAPYVNYGAAGSQGVLTY